jgi:hypothetical protein
MLSTFVNLLQGSIYQSQYTYKYFHDVTFYFANLYIDELE